MNEKVDANTYWVHLFRSMILSGEIAKIGVHAFAVYAYIKANVDFHSGDSFPLTETISDKTGISRDMVRKQLVVLEAQGYITKTKVGRNNIYRLREQIPIQSDGETIAKASWDYIPAGVGDAVADIKNLLLTGDLAGAKIVHIDHLTLNLNIQTANDNATQVNFNEVKDPGLRAKLEKIYRLSEEKKLFTGEKKPG